MKRVGILTSGGDCQGLNATIRAVAKTLYNQLGNDVEIIGIIDGYRGLIYTKPLWILTATDFRFLKSLQEYA